MSDSTIYKDLKLTDNFEVAFPDKRVPNGFIDKTKTRVGITYTNFHDTRHSITVIPSEAIIQDALDNYPYLNVFDVREGITTAMIAEYLLSDAEYKRLATTPESFGKIIAAARSINKLQWLYDNFFLYLDEVHCYSTEAFRVPQQKQHKDDWGILTPFHPEYEYVWEFKNMAMGSATPFEFSDPRIQKLQRHKLRYKEKFGKITIVNDASPLAALQYMLLHPKMFPGRVHIFFNTVTQTGELIRATGITDVNIYCRDEEKNMTNLDEARQYFKLQPIQEEYAKFNFYSCRYNDGWDLKDDESATIILVTDVKIPHSLIGIPFKGYQAVGRLKVTPHKIYHITNNYGKTGMRSFREIQTKWLYNSEQHIKQHNTHVNNCKQLGIEDSGLLYNVVKPFSTFKYRIAQMYNMTLDQIICAEYCKEHYNSPETIRETWEGLNYEVEEQKFDLAPLIRVKRSQEDLNKQVIDHIEELKRNPDDYVYDVARATVSRYQTEFPLLLEAYAVLGPAELERVGYNNKAMKEALVNKSNTNAETKLRQLLIDTFKMKPTTNAPYANRYTNKDIKSKLQSFYDQLGIKKTDGSRKIATAKQLYDFGLFGLNECKVSDEKGNKAPGLEVVRENYRVSSAA